MVKVWFRTEWERQRFINERIVPFYLKFTVDVEENCHWCPGGQCQGHVWNKRGRYLCALSEARLMVRGER
jgi:hypothetical protein